MKPRKWTIDKYGLIAQNTPIRKDGSVTSSVSSGDALNWNCHYLYLGGSKDLSINPDYIIDKLQPLPGVWIRHFDSDQGIWNHYYKAGLINRFYDGIISRDQLTGLVGFLIKYKKRKELLKVILNAATRLFLFSYNFREYDDPKLKWRFPDITGFGIWAMWLRGFGKLSWVFWPILLVFDLIYIVDTILFNMQKDETDNISYLMKMFVSNEYIPTPVSRFAWLIMNKEKAKKDLSSYWCLWWRGNCGMVELYLNKIKEINKKAMRFLPDFLKKLF